VGGGGICCAGEAKSQQASEGRKGDLLNYMARLKIVQRTNNLVDTMTAAHDKINIEAYKKEICTPR